MENIVEKLKQSIRVRSYDVDLFGNLTLPSVCNYFQEIAWEHAQKMDIGYELLKSINKFWVLSRLQVKFYQYPKWTNEITLITWPKGIDGMFALRDFLIFSNTGEKLIAATSSWLILDTEKHRPQKIDSDDHPKYIVDESDAYIHLAEKIPVIQNLEKKNPFQVVYTDIDVNKHVNNVKYIEWAINSQSNKLKDGVLIDEMMVNFVGEASLDDTLSVSYKNENQHSDIVICNATKEKDSCRLKFIYK
jgi:medium-chain acyl-[acyl-carrier-protein] hydrolase